MSGKCSSIASIYTEPSTVKEMKSGLMTVYFYKLLMSSTESNNDRNREMGSSGKRMPSPLYTEKQYSKHYMN